MLGWHLIFTTYGFWPPNDPRGSGSTRVRTWHLYDAAGEATKVDTRRSVAARPHDMNVRQAAKAALKYPAVELTGLQARAIARGIATVCQKVELVIHAGAIMPDHVHVVVAAHRLDGDEIIACLKRAGTRGLNDEELNSMAAYPRANGRLPSPWGIRGWKVKLYTPQDMRDRIRYVERNPLRAGFNPTVELCGAIPRVARAGDRFTVAGDAKVSNQKFRNRQAHQGRCAVGRARRPRRLRRP